MLVSVLLWVLVVTLFAGIGRRLRNTEDRDREVSISEQGLVKIKRVKGKLVLDSFSRMSQILLKYQRGMGRIE